VSGLTLPLLDRRADRFAERLRTDGQSLERRSIRTLQINLGKLCNLACHHCHVESGPGRSELMTWETMTRILRWLDAHRDQLGVEIVDLTGGAPEMNPHFRELIDELTRRRLHVLDRCNLTILLEPGYEDLIDFFAQREVEVVASLPCYLQGNVDGQRGKGVYRDSIEVLRRLNRAGYGMPDSPLKLDLVYNPTGYGLPPPQEALELDYKRELHARFGIQFHRLWTIANMPIKRFEHALRRDGRLDEYVEKLVTAHSPGNVQNVMCRDLVSVGWQGTVYDCDFNQMLCLPIDGAGTSEVDDEHVVESRSRKLWEFAPEELQTRSIRTGTHCFGCTAGAGSSCNGALA
jgi:radical SAM/Cys-rich protein